MKIFVQMLNCPHVHIINMRLYKHWILKDIRCKIYDWLPSVDIWSCLFDWSGCLYTQACPTLTMQLRTRTQFSSSSSSSSTYAAHTHKHHCFILKEKTQFHCIALSIWERRGQSDFGSSSKDLLGEGAVLPDLVAGEQLKVLPEYMGRINPIHPMQY